jgi:dienelactone hydrolase
VVGAASGAAIGAAAGNPAAGAAAGAGSGLLLGSAAGAVRGDWSTNDAQRSYDAGYLQCMYSILQYSKRSQIPVWGAASLERAVRAQPRRSGAFRLRRLALRRRLRPVPARAIPVARLPRSHARPLRRVGLCVVVVLLAATLGPVAGCARLGPIGPGLDGALWRDAPELAPGDAAGPGPLRVGAGGLSVERGGHRFDVVLYRPMNVSGPLPAVVFLPGYLAPEIQYESYARALASRGFLVAVHGRFPVFVSDDEVADAAGEIADWLIAEQDADPARVGVAGHSMGGKGAVLAADRYPCFGAVVAIDPDDRGEPAIDGALARLESPLLLIGAEVAWKGASICADRDHNYERFFERSPPGTVELTLLGADHVQVMDDPEAFGLGICRSGTADSRSVRTLARRATVLFFQKWLLGAEVPPLGLSGIGRVRVAAGPPPSAAGAVGLEDPATGRRCERAEPRSCHARQIPGRLPGTRALPRQGLREARCAPGHADHEPLRAEVAVAILRARPLLGRRTRAGCRACPCWSTGRRSLRRR